MSKSTARPKLGDEEHAEDIESVLGQFICEFGHGVGNLWVFRSTITAIRKRLRGPIAILVNQDYPSWKKKWKAEGPGVLGMMTRVGRLSAHFAMDRDKTIVGPEEFLRALRVVKDEGETGDEEKALGEWCN